ncbi:MAG TPA: 3-isopropylmalate dehydratase small subunit [Candidatus Aerophobetes bacterium]|uniref:3-isopropylmalate dehydratase small subunit n=1 Tax=Aerophobetes bacterium TaxID=2030807 RepID=A0A7V5HYH3_UNCAE|nr:3-isopropylmalate dehydratase small subunit [Candidatus Aerophobetes bacterium]
MSEKILKGKVHKLGDDINTDYIISGRYKFKTLDPNELARHLLEDICPDFYQKISPGDFIVAGENFGCGSSREQAPLAIKYAGIGAVIAKSFARIFYRNAINIGLPIIITDTDEINQDDTLLIDLKKGAITVCNREKTLSITPFPSEILSIIEAGGLVEYFKKYGGWRI